MFCRKCGSQNPYGAARCADCGAQLDNPYQPGGSAAKKPLDHGPLSAAGKPKNWLVASILATLFCCLPLGIVGIVYAAQVDSKWNGGDHHGAIHAAEKAKTWALVSIGLGLILNIGMVVLQLIAFSKEIEAGGFNP